MKVLYLILFLIFSGGAFAMWKQDRMTADFHPELRHRVHLYNGRFRAVYACEVATRTEAENCFENWGNHYDIVQYGAATVEIRKR